MNDTAILKDRRFAVRFLGRPATWAWLAAVLVPGVAAWIWARASLRGFAGDERTWFLWSGNAVLLLFVATMLFVVRKWSIKLKAVRDWGRAPSAMGDASWAEIQTLNAKIRKGAYGGDAEILAAAQEILRRFQVEKIHRVDVRTLRIGDRETKYVSMRKADPFGRLEPWLEMHMGVGVAACVGVWFHADGQIRHAVGWMLFGGSAVLLVTGVVLAVLYRTVPGRLAAVGGEIPFEEAGVARETYERCLAGAVALVPEALRADADALLRRSSSPEDLRRRANELLAKTKDLPQEQRELVRDVLVLAGTRDHLLWSTAPARALDGAMKLWRRIHVPVSVFVFFLIAVHVGLVLWY